MSYKVILTGGTGMIGQGVLLECIEEDNIAQVLSVSRSPLKQKHQKVKELVLPAIEEASSDDLSGYDACLFCAGVSAVGLDEERYSYITEEITVRFAGAFLKANPHGVFCYVSGAGTDSNETSRQMWARVKGRTENRLLAMPFRAGYMLRPGFIQPMKGIRSKTGWYQTMYTILRPVYAILRHFKSSATNTTNVGLAMIALCAGDYQKNILGNLEINELAESS